MNLAVVDGDIAARNEIASVLAEGGHQVRTYGTGAALLRALRQHSYDLVLLDCKLTDISGFQFITWTRENLHPAPPIILITREGTVQESAAALIAGADDCVSKPLQQKVLQARVEAVLRRVYKTKMGVQVEVFGSYGFYRDGRTVTLGNNRIYLTPKEFALALLMFRNLDRPLARDYITKAIWGDTHGSRRTLDTHMSHIRRQLKIRPDNGLRLSAVPGFGYRLERLELVTNDRPLMPRLNDGVAMIPQRICLRRSGVSV